MGPENHRGPRRVLEQRTDRDGCASGSVTPMASWRSAGGWGLGDRRQGQREGKQETAGRGRGPCRRRLQGSCVPLDHHPSPPGGVSPAPCVSQGQTAGRHVVLLRPTSTGAPLESAEYISLHQTRALPAQPLSPHYSRISCHMMGPAPSRIQGPEPQSSPHMPLLVDRGGRALCLQAGLHTPL